MMSYLNIVELGADAWIKLIETEGRNHLKLEGLDLSGKTLTGFDFSGITISQCRFNGGTINNCNFAKATILDCTFSYSIIDSTDFFECSVVCTGFNHAVITNSKFLRSDLMGLEVKQAAFKNVDLRFVRIDDCDFNVTIFEDCKIYGASIWSFKGSVDPKSTLIITPDYESEIVTKDLALAQYIYMMNKMGIVNMHSIKIFDPILKDKEAAYDYHVFISHASEDKDELVRPLAQLLESLGLKVWYDETTLRIGDSLREKIDEGLSKSLLGIVVLSESFFRKSWTRVELNAIFTLDLNKDKYLIPVWHKIGAKEILQFSPLLADRVAIVNNGDLNAMAIRILKEINRITTVGS